MKLLSISVVPIPFATLTTPAIASPTLDPALEQAVKTAIITQHPTADSTHIIVSPINQVKAWVFGSTAIIPQPESTAETDDEPVPRILLLGRTTG